jgi:hypothetical protein
MISMKNSFKITVEKPVGRDGLEYARMNVEVTGKRI